MKKLFSQKYFVIALVAVLALAIFVSPSGIAYAQSAGATPAQVPNLLSCAITGGNLGTCIIFAVTLFFSQIMGLFVSLGAWLVQLGLQFDSNIYNSPVVQGGFGVVLSIANLGFVLAIIIMVLL